MFERNLCRTRARDPGIGYNKPSSQHPVLPQTPFTPICGTPDLDYPPRKDRQSPRSGPTLLLLAATLRSIELRHYCDKF